MFAFVSGHRIKFIYLSDDDFFYSITCRNIFVFVFFQLKLHLSS